MPRPIETDAREAIEVGDLVDILECGRFDPRDEDCFASFGGDLRKLANNGDFLADHVVDELKTRCQCQSRTSSYGPQVIVLHRSERFFIRANFWPAEHDGVMQDNGEDSFFYHVPHDHNFSFLTVGYFGPGYASDYYEYDYDAVAGVPGENVALHYAGRQQLAQGQVMLYRAHHDVHAQLPASSLSVSLNIMEQSVTLPYRDQYRFDTKRSQVAAVLTQAPIEPLLALCAHLGHGNARDLVSDYAASHPSDRIRFSALCALASAHPQPTARLDLFERAASTGNRYIAARAARQIASIKAGSPWLERSC